MLLLGVVAGLQLPLLLVSNSALCCADPTQHPHRNDPPHHLPDFRRLVRLVQTVLHRSSDPLHHQFPHILLVGIKIDRANGIVTEFDMENSKFGVSRHIGIIHLWLVSQRSLPPKTFTAVLFLLWCSAKLTFDEFLAFPQTF